MFKIGILTRFCELYHLLSNAAVAAGFVPDKALDTAIQVVKNNQTGPLLADMWQGYRIITRVPQELASGVRNTREFLEKVGELYGDMNGWAQRISQLELSNPDRELIEYFTSNTLAEALKIVSDVNETYGGSVDELLQTFYEAQETPIGGGVGEGGGAAAEHEHLEQGQMETARRRTEREKERQQELRRLNPKMYPSVARVPATEEERQIFEAKKQKERELLWQKAISQGVLAAKKMGIEDPENSEKAFQLAMEYYNNEAALTPWTPEEVELWREAMRYGIGKALGSRQLEKGVNPWQSPTVRNYARKYYEEKAGRVVGFRQREQALQRLKRLKMQHENPEKYEQEKERLKNIRNNMTEEERKAFDKKRWKAKFDKMTEEERREYANRRLKQKELRKEKLKKQLPPGYTPPKYVDDQVH